MSTLWRKFLDLFKISENKFIKKINEKIETNNFFDLRKIDSKLSMNEKLMLIKDLQKKEEITGIYLAQEFCFISISEQQSNELKSLIKQRGKVKISFLKEKWDVRNSLLVALMNHFERIILGQEYFYSLVYIKEFLINEFQDKQTCNLEAIGDELGVKLKTLIEIIDILLNEKKLDGVIQNDSIYLSQEAFDALIVEYLENNSDKRGEITFEEISDTCKVGLSVIENFLLNYAKRNPEKLIIYPVEKKIQFKK